LCTIFDVKGNCTDYSTDYGYTVYHFEFLLLLSKTAHIGHVIVMSDFLLQKCKEHVSAFSFFTKCEVLQPCIENLKHIFYMVCRSAWYTCCTCLIWPVFVFNLGLYGTDQLVRSPWY